MMMRAAALAVVTAGLALSAVKRKLDPKDWGSIIESQGGALDRLA